MQATLIFEASRSCGAKYRVEVTLGFFALAWLLRLFGP
jgi:hypothetical protein